MSSVTEDSKKIISTIAILLKNDEALSEYRVLTEGECAIEHTGHDNWNEGTDLFGLFCKIPVKLYSEIERRIPNIEQSIKTKAEKVLRSYPSNVISEVVVSPIISELPQNKSYVVSAEDLIGLLHQQKALMIAVATGGQKIQDVNADYILRQRQIEDGLNERDIKNSIVFKDLWAWYGKWSDGTLPKWHERRTFISELFDPLEIEIKKTITNLVNPIFEEPTGWARVDRGIGEIKLRVVQAKTEEQFQNIGLLGRETLISLGQSVYDPIFHPTVDGVVSSKTDAKRMLEAYILAVLPGSSNESIRKHARASLELANELTHKRSADFRLAALCAEATCAVVNVISIISGRRDP